MVDKPRHFFEETETPFAVLIASGTLCQRALLAAEPEFSGPNRTGRINPVFCDNRPGSAP
jgi:hypothetical protein